MACMTHTCTKCHYDIFDNERHYYGLCPECGNDRFIDAFDEEPYDEDRELEKDEEEKEGDGR